MTYFIPLSKLLSSERDPKHICFIEEEKNISWHDYISDVARLTRKIAQQEEQNWLLFCKDIYQFAVSFMALAAAKKKMILPPALQYGAVYEMRDFFDAILCDHDPGAFDTKKQIMSHEGEAVAESFGFDPFDSPQLLLTAFTSGSTGQPKPVEKNLYCFEAEINTLHALWGDKLENTTLATSVTHYHTYGILFAALWPLCEGVPIMVKRVDYPEQLHGYLAQKSISFISSPAFLKRWYNAYDKKVLHNLSQIFSSGAALDVELANSFASLLPSPIIEAYGSTESGGIAYRCNESYWKTMPDVTVSLDKNNVVNVKSPHTGIGLSGWLTMSDKAEMLDKQCFLLKGRVDRIIKIEERRLSLDKIEAKIREILQVEEVHVVVINAKNRDVTAAVVLLTPELQKRLEKIGKTAIVRQLKEELAQHFYRILLPKKWRFVESLPRNATGKLRRDALIELF